MIENLIKENFSLNEKEQKVVDKIICDKMNLPRCEDIIKTMVSLRFDNNSLVAFLGYQLFKVEPERADEIAKSFNKDTSTMFEAFKVIKDITRPSKSEEAEDIRTMFLALSKDLRVVIIKLAGILYDLKTIKLPLDSNGKFFVSNVKNIFAPLAERLGLGEMKSTMEDYCLKYEDPKSYQMLENNILLKKEDNQKQLEITRKRIQAILDELGIKGEITYRQKHISSVFKKIKFKGVTLAQIYDLVAMRVLTNTVEECYEVFGKIHSIYKPLSFRVKDYIANPKPNGYQTLHTTIIAENSKPLEIQIRTFDMHRHAEFGIAAHWIYKEKRSKTTELDKKLFWLRGIMDNAKSMTAEEFMDSLKTDLYDGEIFVQSPKGKVFEFPEGATIIDFAYAIHSDIGNYCVGGKINNVMKPISTKLKSGDIVEIITNPASKGPSRDWLSIVRTSGARSKIKQFFKTELKEENIKIGKTMLDNAIEKRGFTSSQLLKSEYIDEILSKYTMTDMDELYASVGSESLAIGQVVGRLVSMFNRDHDLLKKKEVKSISVKKNDEGITIDGESGMMIKYAKCCNPIIGDEIIGYISHGQGVTIHRKNCSSLNHLEKDRLISAKWEEKGDFDFISEIKVVADKNFNNISRITNVLADLKIAIKSFESKETKDDFTATIAVLVKGKTQIDKIISGLTNLKGMQKVFRSE